MPYFFETKKIKLPVNSDRRYKVSDSDKERILAMYQKGYAIRVIAREFENICSRRTIQRIIFPERAEHMRELNREWQKQNGNSLQRHGKKKWRETVKEHRRYKYTVLSGMVKAEKRKL